MILSISVICNMFFLHPPLTPPIKGNVIDLREIRVTKRTFFLHPPLTPPIKGGEFYESPVKIEIFLNFIKHFNLQNA